MRLCAFVLIVSCGACSVPRVKISNVRVIPMQNEGENWRYAYFDAATRVLARRGYTIRTSDRPAVLNTAWRPVHGLVADEPRLPISFKYQVTTTNQCVRIHGATDICFRRLNALQKRFITCRDSITQTGGVWFRPSRAVAIRSYHDSVKQEILKEVGPIYHDLKRRGAFGPAAPPTARVEPAVGPACNDAPDCSLKCDAQKAEACARLAAMYENGFGVAANMQRALEYYNRACQAGFKAACAKAAGLKK